MEHRREDRKNPGIKRNYLQLPSTLEGFQSYCVTIPGGVDNLRILHEILAITTRWFNWQRTTGTEGKETADAWRDTLNLPLIQVDCGDPVQCREFAPDAPFIEWFPNNPYTEPDLVTDGYNAPAWYQATTASNLILGTQFGDIVTDLSRFPPGSLPTIIPASGLPRFRINLNAPGVVTIHLLNIFAGSIAQITIDDEFGSVRFIDMDRDQIAIPFETATTTPVEVEVVGEGSHFIDVIVVSQINDSIPFLHHGGGLRKVEICGEAADMPFYELRTNPDDPCSVQQRHGFEGEWTEAFRMDNCCDDETIYTRYNEDGIMETSTDGETWEENREDDPRFYPPTLPPLTGEPGGVLRCEAANNVTGALHAAADEIIADSAAWGSMSGLIAVVMTAILVFIAGASLGTLTPLVLGLVGAMLSTGSAGFAAAMTSGVYQDFLCIVYCNTPADGTYTEADWQAIKAQVLTDFTGIASTFFHEQMNIMGLAGLNNASRAGINEGLDCDDCPCDDTWCYLFDFVNDGNGGWSLQPRNSTNFGTYELGSGWVYTDATAVQAGVTTGSREVRIKRTFTSADITKVIVGYNWAFGHSDSTALQAFDLSVGGTVRLTKTFATLTPGTAQEIEWETTGVLATSIEVGLRSSRDISAPITYSGNAVILTIQVEGHGTNPFGEDNCE